MIDIQIEMPDGTITRVRKVSPVQTKRAAAVYERGVREALLAKLVGREEKEAEPATTATTQKTKRQPKEKRAPRLAAFCEHFLETYATTHNRPSTVREKRRALGRGLLDHVGHLRLDRITARHIETFKARRKREGVGPKSINEELAILSKVLNYAEEIGELRQPPPKIRRLKVPKPKYDFLDFDEADRLLEAVAEAPQPWRAMIPLALWSGLRLGELRALQWEDVDLTVRCLHVRYAADYQNVLHPPKSGQPRVVDLPRKAVALLRKHRHDRGRFVFCRADGSMLPAWECESRSMEAKDDSPLMKVCRAAGLRRIGWHVLRHTYASHLMMRGATPAEVQQLLGHASLTMTMRYSHLSPRARKRAAELLDGDNFGAP